jgi:hypothetical protein
MEIGLLILEGVTLAVVVFGALPVFSIRRWFVGTNDATPPWLWLRFTVLLFGFCLIALIEGFCAPIRSSVVCPGCWYHASCGCEYCAESVGTKPVKKLRYRSC